MTEERSLQWKIENEWTISKVLVTAMNPKMFLYQAGLNDIYVQDVRPIPTVLTQSRHIPYHFGKQVKPHIAILRSKSKDEVLKFISDFPEFECSRIFKSGLYFSKLTQRVLMGFSKQSIKNALHLKPGSAFRFKSNRKELRDILYKDAVLINGQDGIGCTFDFDKFDYTFEARVYKRDNGGYAIISFIYGWDLPNHWHL